MQQTGHWRLICLSLASQAVDINAISFPHLLCYHFLFEVQNSFGFISITTSYNMEEFCAKIIQQ